MNPKFSISLLLKPISESPTSKPFHESNVKLVRIDVIGTFWRATTGEHKTFFLYLNRCIILLGHTFALMFHSNYALFQLVCNRFCNDIFSHHFLLKFTIRFLLLTQNLNLRMRKSSIHQSNMLCIALSHKEPISLSYWYDMAWSTQCVSKEGKSPWCVRMMMVYQRFSFIQNLNNRYPCKVTFINKSFECSVVEEKRFSVYGFESLKFILNILFSYLHLC